MGWSVHQPGSQDFSTATSVDAVVSWQVVALTVCVAASSVERRSGVAVVEGRGVSAFAFTSGGGVGVQVGGRVAGTGVRLGVTGTAVAAGWVGAGAVGLTPWQPESAVAARNTADISRMDRQSRLRDGIFISSLK
jgi:hypothetical protein